MINIGCRCIVLFLLVLAVGCRTTGNMKSMNQVTIFPVPDGVKASPFYTVAVNGQQAFTYHTYRQDRTSTTTVAGCSTSPLAFSTFDFRGTVHISINVSPDILLPGAQPVIRPLSSGIVPEVHGNRIEFTLDQPGNYTLDPRGDGYCALHLFTNEPETDIPDPDDPDIRYFGPGVHTIDSLDLHSGQTLYLAGGAYLHCRPTTVVTNKIKAYGIEMRHMEQPIRIEDVKGVTIRGRGIISCAGGVERKERFSPLYIRGARDLTIRDVVLLESSLWNINLMNCEKVRIDNLRIVSFYVNSDGICATSKCRDIRTTNSFVHNADDALEVKSMDSFWGYIPENAEELFGPCEDIHFENCLVWNDLATPIGITHEIAHPVRNVTFRNITVLHHTSRTGRYPLRGQISIFPAAGGPVSNVTFENITVESATAAHTSCISIDNTHGHSFKKVVERYADRPHSTIEDITFRNITIQTDHPAVRLINRSSDPVMRDIHFDQVTINGQPLSSDAIESENAEYQILK